MTKSKTYKLKWEDFIIAPVRQVRNLDVSVDESMTLTSHVLLYLNGLLDALLYRVIYVSVLCSSAMSALRFVRCIKAHYRQTE